MAFLTPNAHGEVGVIDSFVRNQLAQVRNTTHGLTDDQWHQRSTVSEFTLATLVDHVGLVVEQFGVGIEASVGGPADYVEGSTEGEVASVETHSGEQLLAGFDRRVSGFGELLDRIAAAIDARAVEIALGKAP